ncbi:hypothetical protein [Neorhizobium sp. NCHU2750]|uniref:hypothetical protein n=1 Tax=Neorhizobium sp. NCHU2750 TaxID=1825976 RepID=UPI000E7136F7|nr:hypothetical protein NCHU2750_19460 [Neorhizobium sp. NCHU2750]
MSGIRFSFPACVIAGKGRIDRHDLLILRKYTFADGIRTYEDALLLLALNDMCPIHCDEWPAYFVEQLTTFIVDEAAPRGRIDATKSAWLMRALALDGRIVEPAQLECLLHAMERAESCPDILSAFALDQLRHALCGRPAGGCSVTSLRLAGITADDLAYVWRILRKRVSSGRLLVSALEASSLRMIQDIVQDRDNHPGWDDVMAFVSGEERAGSLRNRPWLMTTEGATGWNERVA